VSIDTAAGYVEVDGTIPIDVNNAETPRVYLEVFVCTPDTKEHESVVVTKAKPSHVHAALLLLGIEPGKPGEWNWDDAKLRAIPPEGPQLNVDLIDPATGRVTPLARCATSVRDQTSLADRKDGHFVFAGSRVVKRKTGEVYWADGDGTLMGLTAFGGETIAWSEMFSHDSAIEEPHWIADKAFVPPVGTPVVVRISVPKLK
jgi:hypothetical protein